MAKAATEVPKQVIRDAETQDYIERAKIAREQRRAAPMTGLDGKIKIPQKEAIARFSKDTGGQNGEFHWMFGDREMSSYYADQGYEPVLDQGRHFSIAGDPMWKIPTDLHQSQLEAIAAESNRILKARREETVEGTEGGATATNEVKVSDGSGDVKQNTFSSPE